MDIQLSVLEFFQSLRSPILNAIFLIFTISTELPILVLFTATIYWCINKKVGQKILFSLVSSITLNTGIKEFVLQQDILFQVDTHKVQLHFGLV